MDIEGPLSAFYSPGDEASAFVLDYNERGQMSLTQFADWEIDSGLIDLDEDEDGVDVSGTPIYRMHRYMYVDMLV